MYLVERNPLMLPNKAVNEFVEPYQRLNVLFVPTYIKKLLIPIKDYGRDRDLLSDYPHDMN
jgi:hypothetical protein